MEKQNSKPPVELSLEGKVGEIISRLEQLIKEHEIINPEPFQKIINELSTQVSDVVVIEKSMNAIRREITEPVKLEIEKSSKLGKFSVWGFWVGIVGGLLAISSIALSIYWNFDNSRLIASLKADNEKLISSIESGDKELLSKIEAKFEEYQNSQDTYSQPGKSYLGKGSSLTSPFITDVLGKEVHLGSYIYLPDLTTIQLKSFNPDKTVNLTVEYPQISMPEEHTGLITSELKPSVKDTVSVEINNAKVGKIWEFDTLLSSSLTGSSKKELHIDKIDDKNLSITISTYDKIPVGLRELIDK